PEPRGGATEMAKANPAAAMSGMIIPRTSPPSVDDTTRSIWSRPEFHIKSLVEREVQERDSDRAGEEHDEDAEQQPAEADVRECALVVVQLARAPGRGPARRTAARDTAASSGTAASRAAATCRGAAAQRATRRRRRAPA